METTLNHFREDFNTHTKDDLVQFKDLKDKLDAMHDIQITNQAILRECLGEVKKTNGRVTSLEAISVRLDKSYALMEQTQQSMANILSRQHNQYETFVKQREQLDSERYSKMLTKEEFAPYKNGSIALISMVLVAVVVAVLSMVVIHPPIFK
jgi:hypothetical protein